MSRLSRSWSSARAARAAGIRAALAISLTAATALGCGGDDDGDPGDADDSGDDDDGGADDGPRVAFSLPEPGQPVAIARIPFPNDLVRDEAGEIDVTVESLPFAANARQDVMASVAAAFAEVDCFGPGAGVVFPLEGLEDGDAIDPASLTDGAVQLIHLASGELVATERTARAGQQQIHVRPARGVTLAPGATYAAVVTRDVALEAGATLEPALDLVAVLGDAAAGDERLAAATRAYAPLREHLAGGAAALDAEAIAGAAVFTTCDYSADLDAVVADLDERLAPVFALTRLFRAGPELDDLLGTPADNRFPGVDNPGGIAHADIGFVVAGTFASPNYQSATPGLLGTWERDERGRPAAKGEDDVPVLLVLPAASAVDSYADLPVVVLQHGLGEAKTAVLAVANTLAARGFAVIGIDIPFHGGRFPDARDVRHNFTDAEEPDGLADPTGPGAAATFFDLLGDEAASPLDPRVQTDTFRQAAVDVMALSRLVDGGDLAAIRAADPALAELGLRGDRIVYASESFGGFIGVLALAFEPRYQAGFLSVAGGGLLTDLLENSPTYGPLFMPVLGGAFGVSPQELDPAAGPPHTHQAFQFLALLLGGADPMSYAHRLPGKGVHVVLPAAFADESVPNQAGEGLAAALGLSWAQVPGAVEGPGHVAADMLPIAPLPLSGNLEVDGVRLTAGYFELDPASHGMLTRGRGQHRYEPEFPPFIPLDEPVEFDNPIVSLQAYLVEFAETYIATGLPAIGQDPRPVP